MSELTTISFSEKELLQRIARGDTQAFRQLFERYADPVFSFAAQFTRQRESAQDIVQEVFAKVWEQRQKLLEVEHFESWIFVVVRNYSFSYMKKLLRQSAREIKWSLEQPEEFTGAGDLMETKDYEQLMHRAIGQLSPQQQKVFTLHRQGDMSQTEIARQLGLTTSSVKKHLARARRSLTCFLREHQDLALFLSILLGAR